MNLRKKLLLIMPFILTCSFVLSSCSNEMASLQEYELLLEKNAELEKKIENLEKDNLNLTETNDYLIDEKNSLIADNNNLEQYLISGFFIEELEIFKETYDYLENHTYDKVTLTNQDNITVDITDNIIWNEYFMRNYSVDETTYEKISSMVTNTYVYTFYFGEESKTIILGANGDFDSVYNNEILYDVAKSIMPIHSYFNKDVYSPKTFMLAAPLWRLGDWDFPGERNAPPPYGTDDYMRNIIINWVSKYTEQIDGQPSQSLTKIDLYTCYLHGQEAYFEMFDDVATDDKYYDYIKLSYGDTIEFYEVLDDTYLGSLLSNKGD